MKPKSLNGHLFLKLKKKSWMLMIQSLGPSGKECAVTYKTSMMHSTHAMNFPWHTGC